MAQTKANDKILRFMYLSPDSRGLQARTIRPVNRGRA
jgi:hypothetical protein